MLTTDGCRARQDRLRARLAANDIAAAVVTDPRDVYYFSRLLPGNFPVLLYLPVAGNVVLFAPSTTDELAVDERLTYETNTLYTLNPDPMERLAAILASRMAAQPRGEHLGWQAESLSRRAGEVLARALAPDGWETIDETVRTLQQRKDADELHLLRKANAVNLAAYAAARRAIVAGANELEVLGAAQAAASMEAGEPVQVGGDYRSNAFGGPARFRVIEDGELYIVDSGVSYRGYWSDLSRTFAVGETTELQRSVYAHVAAVLTAVPNELRPGRDGSEVWRWMDARLREHPHLAAGGLVTHGGHGIGTRAHEMPDINRDRGGGLAVGNVVTCEPGGYSAELRAGIRLENAFAITEAGAENLSPFPLSLTEGVWVQ